MFYDQCDTCKTMCPENKLVRKMSTDYFTGQRTTVQRCFKCIKKGVK
jgi:hypothetical protein